MELLPNETTQKKGNMDKVFLVCHYLSKMVGVQINRLDLT